jgi:hypothetical protein
VLPILLARLHEALFGGEVVIAVGQPEAGGEDGGDHVGGIVIVGRRPHTERRGDLQLVQARDHRLHARARPDRIDVGQQRLDRLRAQLVDPFLIHAGAVEVGDLLVDRALRIVFQQVAPLRQIVEDGPQLLLAQLSRRPAPAPALHRRRNRIGPPPRTVRIVEEIRTGIGAAVDVVVKHPVLRRRRLREERGGEEKGGQGEAHRGSIRTRIRAAGAFR